MKQDNNVITCNVQFVDLDKLKLQQDKVEAEKEHQLADFNPPRPLPPQKKLIVRIKLILKFRF